MESSARPSVLGHETGRLDLDVLGEQVEQVQCFGILLRFKQCGHHEHLLLYVLLGGLIFFDELAVFRDVFIRRRRRWKICTVDTITCSTSLTIARGGPAALLVSQLTLPMREPALIRPPAPLVLPIEVAQLRLEVLAAALAVPFIWLMLHHFR